METIFIHTEDSKTNESHKFILNLTQILDLKKLKHDKDKHVAFQNLCIYYNKLKIIASTWNDVFELPGGSYSVSDIED